jgi:hypothetical protein
LLLETLEVVLHRFELFRGVPLPVRDFAGDPQRIARAVGLRRIAREPLVRQVGVILDRPRRFDGVDPARFFAGGQLGAQTAAFRVALE